MAANHSRLLDCFTDPAAFYTFVLFTMTSTLLLPLSLYILYLGFSQWRQRRPISHLDHFTFHVAAMELIPLCGCVMFSVSAYSDDAELIDISLVLFSPIWSAKLHFNSLTCVERYLAVVHPIAYLDLKKSGRGVMIRNVSIGFLWLLGLGWFMFDFFSVCFNAVSFLVYEIMLLLSLCLAFTITSFCNLLVLCVLVHPGPAKGGGNKVKVDLSKKRAFHTVAAILGVLFVGTCGILVSESLTLTNTLSECAFLNACVWLTLPCSLVLPLLFLQRMGKFSF